ncbi:MAG: lipid-A-disaccharide synthase [Nitrospirae bacterium]|nr:lipid-A-disaccharide synthase [Nitrospirota bacterium]
MISAGEASGELYGALLSREIKRLWPDADIIGIGGSRMRSEGVNLIAPITHSMGVTEVIRNLSAIRKTFKKAVEALAKYKPEVLVLIDYPDFNIVLAKKAKNMGIPILYYVSPQVWAWRRGRVKKIASLVKKIAVLFPFEADIYRNAGLSVEFVGHPIAETMDISGTREEIKQRIGLNPSLPVVSLLPGSRPSEIKRHLSLLIEVAEKIRNEFPEFQIVLPLTPEVELSEKIPDYIMVLKGLTREAVLCSEAAAVASGTATFETALIGTPMVVFYKLSALTFLIARMLVKVKFISLVNILSDREVVVELVQDRATAGNIFSEIKRIITDSEYRKGMMINLNAIKDLMGKKTASKRVAELTGELAGWNTTSAY